MHFVAHTLTKYQMCNNQAITDSLKEVAWLAADDNARLFAQYPVDWKLTEKFCTLCNYSQYIYHNWNVNHIVEGLVLFN